MGQSSASEVKPQFYWLLRAMTEGARDGSVAQLVERLSSMHKVLSLSPSTMQPGHRGTDLQLQPCGCRDRSL